MPGSKSRATEKRKLFVEAMLVNGGDKKAAAEAAGAKPGNAARIAGQRMSKEPAVKRLLKKRWAAVLKEASKKAQLTANDAMASLGRDIHFDPAQLFHADGRPKLMHELDRDTRVALRGFKMKAITKGSGKRLRVIGYDLEVKYPEKTAAREQAMKHFGLYERDNKQKPFYTPPQLIVVGVPGRAK